MKNFRAVGVLLLAWALTTPIASYRAIGDEPAPIASESPTPEPSASPQPSPSASPLPIKPESWWDQLIGWSKAQIEQFLNDVPNAIFDAINDIGIYTYSGNDLTVDLSIHRRVFDNGDLQNSFTVADRFVVKGLVPIASDTLGALGGTVGSTGAYGFNIGASFGLEFVNIRQVLRPNLASLPSAEARKKEIEHSKVYRDFAKQQQDVPRGSNDDTDGDDDADDVNRGKDTHWQVTLDEEGNKQLSLLPKDPENNARYSKLWNLVLFPFRLPLTSDSVYKLGVGEIISYVGSGAVQFGASVGWSIDPAGLSGLATAGFSYSAYVRGTYRFSVMKIVRHDDASGRDKVYAKVKVTREAGIGHGAGGGVNYKPSLFDGVVVLKEINGFIKISPFSAWVGQEIARSFDVGYEYDMENPNAREAYEKAVRGNLSPSDDLSFNLMTGEKHDPQKTGVEKVFERRATTETRGISQRMRLGFAFEGRSSATFTKVQATIYFPDGTFHELHTISDSSRQWRTFYGEFEKFQHSFRVNLDIDRYEKNPGDPTALSMVFQGRIDDSGTSPKEALRYILEVEDAIGIPDVFPHPSRKPKDGAVQPEIAPTGLGRSSFFYQVTLSNAQLNKFIHTPERKMWEIVGQAFGEDWSTPARRLNARIGEYFIWKLPGLVTWLANVNLRAANEIDHGSKIVRRWKKLKDISDFKKRAVALGKLFYDRVYARELVHIVRGALDHEKVRYQAMGYIKPYGRKYLEGHTELNFEDIASRAQKEIDYDLPGPRPPTQDAEATVGQLNVHVLDAYRAEVRFNLAEVPQWAYIDIQSVDPLWPWNNQVLAWSRVQNNNGLFRKGYNAFVWDSRVAGGPFTPLPEQLEPRKRYKIRIAVSNDGSRPGMPAESDVFKMMAPPKPPR